MKYFKIFLSPLIVIYRYFIGEYDLRYIDKGNTLVEAMLIRAFVLVAFGIAFGACLTFDGNHNELFVPGMYIVSILLFLPIPILILCAFVKVVWSIFQRSS